MLNTGLLLSKPGESGYSKYRRFLIANSVSTLKISGMIDELYAYCSEDTTKKEKPSINKPHQLSVLATSFEDLFIKKNHINLKTNKNILFNGDRPIKNCPKCSELGYHTSLYDYDWITKCPIHNVKLVTNCPTCNNPWPSISQLKISNCTDCGANLKLNKLVKQGALNYSLYEVYEYIQLKLKNRFLNSNLKISLIEPKTNYMRPPINRVSKYSFSILKALGELSQNEYLKLDKLGIPFYEMSIHNYKTNNSNSDYSQSDLNNKVSEIKIQRSKLLYKQLSKLTPKHHNLTDCEFCGDACVACATWYIWIVINNVVKDFYPEMWLDSSRTRDFFFEETTTKPNVINQLKVVYDIENGFHEVQNLPEKLKLLIYKIDLNTTAIHLYNYVCNFLEITSKGNSTWIEVNSMMKSVSKISNSCFCDFHMDIDKDNLTVIYPKSILSNTLFKQ